MMKTNAETMADNYGDKIKFYQPEDYFGQGIFSEQKQMIRTKLEVAKIFLEKIA